MSTNSRLLATIVVVVLLVLGLLPLIILHRSDFDAVRTPLLVERTRLSSASVAAAAAGAAAAVHAAPPLLPLPAAATHRAAAAVLPAAPLSVVAAAAAAVANVPVTAAAAAAAVGAASGSAAHYAPSAARCVSTAHGQHYLADDQGFVCRHRDFDHASGCCLVSGEASLSGYPRHSCATCEANGCCTALEFCVACCFDPSRAAQAATMRKKARGAGDPALPVVAPALQDDKRPVSHVASPRDAFRACHSRCRANSRDTVHMNAYRSPAHHCFDLAPLGPPTPTKGGVGESCDAVCAAVGKSCFVPGFAAVNTCAQMKAAFGCATGCEKSAGGDQPAYVDDGAAEKWGPGKCLVLRSVAAGSCTGRHEATRRLCPCAQFGL